GYMLVRGSRTQTITGLGEPNVVQNSGVVPILVSATFDIVGAFGLQHWPVLPFVGLFVGGALIDQEVQAYNQVGHRGFVLPAIGPFAGAEIPIIAMLSAQFEARYLELRAGDLLLARGASVGQPMLSGFAMRAGLSLRF